MGEMEEKNQPAVEPARINSEKTAVLADIAKRIQALDNPVKLNILSILVESGSLSITDISKKLDINFSTAHKYLEQLEAASLVTSKQIADNRLKRMFFIKDFNIELSPKSLFNNNVETNNKCKPKFKLFSEKGEVIDFDEEKFAQKYIKRGMPRGTFLLALQETLPQAYDGMTLLELRRLFRKVLEKKAENVTEVLKQVDKDANTKRTFAHQLSVMCPEALEMHANGDIFIKNLQNPVMLKFSHDIRSIYIHGGVNGEKRPQKLGELLSHIDGVIDVVADYAKVSHILDSFNYLVAPTLGKTITAEDITDIKKFFTKLNSKGMRFYIGLEFGLPAWTEELPTHYYLTDVKKQISYSDYCEIAQILAKECLKILAEAKLENVIPVVKICDKKFDMSLLKDLPSCLLANMLAPWQGNAASYSVGARFDTRWKGWVRTGKVGEVQNITINLPRLAHKAKSEAKFFQELELLLNRMLEYISFMAEFATGEFLRNKTSFNSAIKGHWDCTHVEDSAYYVSVTGLDEAVWILNGKKMSEDSKLAEKVLKNCQKVISAYDKMPLRIELKGEPDATIAIRFHNLDRKLGITVKSYTPGANCKDYLTSVKLQQYLLGGHCTMVPKKEFVFDDFIKTNGGLVKLT